MSELLRLERATVGRGRSAVLHEISLTVAEGETVALVGPVGVGKTTLLRTIMGLEPALGGRLFLSGRDVTRATPEVRARAGIGWCPEGARVFPGLSARDNLRVASFGPRRERERDVERVFRLFPALAGQADRPAWTLSGGQRQALAIGRALMGRPRLLILDEPSLGLAPETWEATAASIRSAARDGVAALIAEATPERASAIADRLISLAPNGALSG